MFNDLNWKNSGEHATLKAEEAGKKDHGTDISII